MTEIDSPRFICKSVQCTTNLGTCGRAVGYVTVTNRKVLGSRPSGVNSFFNLPNPSSDIMALRVNQHLTEISTRRYLWGVERGRRVRLTISPPTVSWLFKNVGSSSLEHYRPQRSVTEMALLLLTSPNPSNRTMALEFIQPVTEISTRNFREA
jgi:hypothetical protein